MTKATRLRIYLLRVIAGFIVGSVPAYVFDSARLNALEEFAILDSEAEPGFDDIVQLTRLICHTSIALVIFVSHDRQWFKARAGFEPSETDLSSSVCAHALVESDLLVIPDLTLDPRTADNPLVAGAPHFRFYAGAPLRTPEGHVLGSLCAIDGTPRPDGLTQAQAELLRGLARQVMTQLELRKALARQRETRLLEAAASVRRTGLLTLGDKLRDVSTIEEMTRFASAIVGETLGANRAGFGSLSDDGEFIDVEPDWTAPGVASVRGRHRIADYGSVGDDIRAGRPLLISDIETDPRTASNARPLRDLGVRSLVNMVVLERGRPVALFFVHFDKPSAWSPELVAFLRSVADRVEIGVARLKAEAEQRVLNHELSHRMKNTFMMVQAIAGQTLKDIGDRPAVEAFRERIHALSTAHDILLTRSWIAADLGEVIRNVTDRVCSGDRFDFSGPSLMISPRATLSLSLLMHELSTNAMKYGALSVPAGKVSVSWRVEHGADDLVLLWRERGGPPPGPSGHRGFGSRLIRMGLIGTGGADLRYTELGFEVDFRAPLPEVQQA